MATATPQGLSSREGAIAEAHALIDQGQTSAALDLGEQARQLALASESVADLTRVLDLAWLAHRESNVRSERHRAARLAHAVEDDIRLLSPRPDLLAVRPSVGALVLGITASLLYAGVLALLGGEGTTTEADWLRSVVPVLGFVWLVFAALQLVWWRRGYRKFWRPIYPVTLFAAMALLLLPLLLLLWPRFRRWLLAAMSPRGPDIFDDVFDVLDTFDSSAR
jgi:hypothetical protein